MQILLLVLSVVIMGVVSLFQFLFFFRDWGSKDEVWEPEIIDDEAVFIDGLGYVFKDQDPRCKKTELDESELAYCLDRLRDLNAEICKKGCVGQVGRKLNAITHEPEKDPVQIENVEVDPFETVLRSKVRQVNPSKLRDLSPYCKGS